MSRLYNSNMLLSLLLRANVLFAVMCSVAMAGGQAADAGGRQLIPLTDPKLKVNGIHYIQRNNYKMAFSRFSDQLLALPIKQAGVNTSKARGLSGGELVIKTDSDTLVLNFIPGPGVNRGADFGILENGQWVKRVKFSAKTKAFNITVSSKHPGKVSVFTIVLPSFSNPVLTALSLERDSKLLSPDETDKPTYIALGDSITHGVGQGSASYLTYPYLLSKLLDYQLFNLAVGGGKISVPIADMLTDFERVDLVTILIGYNDWVFDGKTPMTYQLAYRRLIDKVLLHHPHTKILSISPTYTRKQVSNRTADTYKLDQYRYAVSEVVDEYRQKGANITFVEGDSVTSELNLDKARPKDPVHLGVPGAALFATELFNVIQLQ